MTMQVLLFVGRGSLWGSKAVDLPKLLGKGSGNDVTYNSEGAFEDRTKKEGQLQPMVPLFQHPSSKQHQPENAVCLLLLCPFTTKMCCWLPPDLGGISCPHSKDRDCTT